MSKRPSKKKRSQKKSRLLLLIVGIFVCAVLLWYFSPSLFTGMINAVSEELGLPFYIEITQDNFDNRSDSGLGGSNSEQNSENSSAGSLISSSALTLSENFGSLAGVTVQLPEDLEIPLCPATDPSGDPELLQVHQIRKFVGYTICYREPYEQPEWAAYTLTPEKLVKNASRGDNFRADPEITTGSAELSDYRSSGYDRGHLAPAADMSYSKEAMSDSFYLSNMSPQEGSFNRGVWAKAEAYVRTRAADYDITYVVTGPVLDKDATEYKSIGVNNVSVPEFYYKTALFVRYPDAEDSGASQNPLIDTWAILIPNAKLPDNLEVFEVSIDEIEEATGLDLFYLLDDEIEMILESSSKEASLI